MFIPLHRSMPLRHTSVVAMITCLAACSSVRSLWQEANNDEMEGRIAPEIVGTRWVTKGERPPELDYTGHYTVLVFFDPSAPASAGVLQDLEELRTTHGPNGVVFIGLTDADRERLGIFTERAPLGFSVLTEAAADRRNFGIKKLFEPEILVVDPYQRVVGEGLEDAKAILQRR